jgi:hypothetical protein
VVQSPAYWPAEAPTCHDASTFAAPAITWSASARAAPAPSITASAASAAPNRARLAANVLVLKLSLLLEHGLSPPET